MRTLLRAAFGLSLCASAFAPPVHPFFKDVRFARRLAGQEILREEQAARDAEFAPPPAVYPHFWCAEAIRDPLLSVRYLSVLYNNSPRMFDLVSLEAHRTGRAYARLEYLQKYVVEAKPLRWSELPEWDLHVPVVHTPRFTRPDAIVRTTETVLLISPTKVFFYADRWNFFDPKADSFREGRREGSVTDPENLLLPAERVTAEVLQRDGYQLEARLAAQAQRNPEGVIAFPPASIGGALEVPIEFKRLQPGARFKTVFNVLKSSGRGHIHGQSPYIVLDVRETDLTEMDVIRGLRLLIRHLHKTWNRGYMRRYREIRFLGKNFDNVYVLLNPFEFIVPPTP